MFNWGLRGSKHRFVYLPMLRAAQARAKPQLSVLGLFSSGFRAKLLNR